MRLLAICCVAIALIINCSALVLAAEHDELPSGYMSVVNESGAVIYETGRRVHPGDEFIDEENRLYEILSVDDSRALAVQKANVSQEIAPELAIPVQAAPEEAAPLIAVYHTHTDESYIPTEGKASTPGKGGILKVGEVFVNKLTELGYRTVHSKTLHEPHDANAYHRSRRTFVKLLANKPTALFDIHRDSAPLRSYITRINGQDVSKIVLVVGRQNQNRKTTEKYAKQIKAAADSKYKGLIRGIFIAHGNYNQDIMPRSMLLEVGTQYNSRIAAERGITYFAETVPLFIKLPKVTAQEGSGAVAQTANDTGAPPPQLPGAAGEGDAGYGSDIAVILAALVVGTGIYLYISTGSWQELKRKLKHLRNVEFTNFLGSWRRRHKK